MARRSTHCMNVRQRSTLKPHRRRASGWGVIALGVAEFLFGVAAADQPPTAEPLQQPAAKSGKSDLETVTITAKQQQELIERQISKFVSSITLSARDESLARWQVPICPLVAGMRRDAGEFVLARLSEVARNAGAPLAPEQCTPNFLVILTSEPDLLLKKWWARNPRLFNDERGIGGIHHFVNTHRPVRVWYNATSECVGGPETNYVGNGGVVYATCSHGVLGSRLTWASMKRITLAIVVADTGLVKDLGVGQLADYIAMVGMAQIRESAKPGDAPTILRLFSESGEARPKGLSPWDQAFLKSLYVTDPSNVTQISEIKFNMDGTLAPYKPY
jgi:hypothetical protein